MKIKKKFPGIKPSKNILWLSGERNKRGCNFRIESHLTQNFIILTSERIFDLKGQCHEMVVEVRPWSGSLALN
jgi:hypothetical protein